MFALALLVAAQAAPPPIHRAYSIVLGDMAEFQSVRRGIAYYSSRKKVGAFNVRDGKAVWEKPVGWGYPAAIGPNDLFVVDQEPKDTLLAFDLKSGTRRKLATLDDVDAIAAQGETVYISFGRTVQARSSATGKIRWSKTLAAGKARGVSLQSLSPGISKLYVGMEGVGFCCLDSRTGKLLWKKNPKYGAYHPATPVTGAVVVSHEAIECLDERTGKVKWTYPGDGELRAVIDDVLIVKDKGILTGVDVRNGAVKWTIPNRTGDGEYYSGGFDGLAPSDGQQTLLEDNGKALLIGKKGEIIWAGPPPFTGSTCYFGQGTLLCSDGERFLGYASGAPTPIPSDEAGAKALADKLVRDFESLDGVEIDQVKSLARYTTKPMIGRYVQWASERGATSDGDSSGRGMLLYTLLGTVAQILSEMATVDDTPELLSALERLNPKSEYRDNLERILGSKGDPAQSVSLFIKQLQRTKGSREESQAALDAVASSKHPDAVAFMIKALKDPKAPASWRHEAFVHLPGTGGQAGIDAVKSARRVRGPIQTWQTTFGEMLGAEAVKSEKRDGKGRIWRLVQSGVLGNYGDFYLQGKQGSGWSEPIFLDFYDSKPWGASEVKDVRGVPVKKMIDSEWIKVFPDDAGIRKDQDRDGLTDLVEARLGTNPANGDSDDDGLADPVDPCPMTAPRPLGDREKIVSACVEARFFAEPWRVPATIGVEGVEPFELYGYGSPLFWTQSGRISQMYGTGMNSLSLHAAGRMEQKVEPKDWVVISADGKSAVTLISRYSGGLNGDGIRVDLIKVGDDWYVTKMRMEYVS